MCNITQNYDKRKPCETIKALERYNAKVLKNIEDHLCKVHPHLTDDNTN